MRAEPEDTASPRTAPTRVGVATGARFLLALTCAWIGGFGGWRLAALARTVRDSGLVPGGAGHAVALVWCLAALGAAVALVNPTTARAGAAVALVVAAAALAVSVATWARGGGVVCACVTTTVRRTTRDHVEAVAGDLVLVGLAVVTLLRPPAAATPVEDGLSVPRSACEDERVAGCTPTTPRGEGSCRDAGSLRCWASRSA